MKGIIYSLVLIGIDVVILINLFMFFDVAFGPFNQYLDHWDFNNYYFGFKSIIRWLEDMPSGLSINFFFDLLNDFTKAVTGINIGNLESIDIINVVTALFFGPLLAILETIKGIAKVLQLILNIIGWIYTLFSGYYNIKLSDLPQSDISVDPTYLDPNWWKESARFIIDSMRVYLL